MDAKKNTPVLTAEWFAMQRSGIDVIIDSDFEDAKKEKLIYLLELIETYASQPPVPDVVEVMKQFTADPHCKSCKGTGKLGMNLIYDKTVPLGKFYQVQYCYCIKPVESEYARLEKKIEQFQQLLEQRDVTLHELLREILASQRGQASVSALIFNKVETVDSRIGIMPEIMKAWGFTYKTVGFVWNKLRLTIMRIR